MRTVLDTYTNKRFSYNGEISVKVDDIYLKSAHRSTESTCNWLHPLRLREKDLLKFNPDITSTQLKTYKKYRNQYEEHKKENL